MHSLFSFLGLGTTYIVLNILTIPILLWHIVISEPMESHLLLCNFAFSSLSHITCDYSFNLPLLFQLLTDKQPSLECVSLQPNVNLVMGLCFLISLRNLVHVSQCCIKMANIHFYASQHTKVIVLLAPLSQVQSSRFSCSFF